MLNLELTDHLGNVRAVVGGMKKPGNLPNIYSLSDMYPFGMPMPGRQFVSEEYRFGYNGQEKDNEISGTGNSYTAEFWQYDSRLGRRWNVEPVTYPWQSSYACFNNNPIYFADPLGLQGEGGAGGYELPEVTITGENLSTPPTSSGPVQVPTNVPEAQPIGVPAMSVSDFAAPPGASSVIYNASYDPEGTMLRFNPISAVNDRAAQTAQVNLPQNPNYFSQLAAGVQPASQQPAPEPMPVRPVTLFNFQSNQSEYPSVVIIKVDPNIWPGGGITIPPFIIIESGMYAKDEKDLLNHEHGHMLTYLQFSAMAFNPASGYAMYIGVIGVPSVLSSAYRRFINPTWNHMKVFTEKWANQLEYWLKGKPSDWEHTDYPVYKK